MAEGLLKCVPFVLDFLDIDNSDIIDSGILDDSAYDDDISAAILHAMKERSQNETEEKETDSCQENERQRKERVLPNSTNYDDKDFRNCYRMNGPMFRSLLTFLETQTDLKEQSGIKHKGRPELSTEIKLYLTLHYLGSRKALHHLASIYHVSDGSVYVSVKKVVAAIYQAMQSFIKWPEQSKLLEIANNIFKKTGMPRVIGVIDVSHIRVRTPVAQKDYYTNPHGKSSIILQAVCDDNMRFLHCCTGWPGSLDDASVFHDSDLYTDVTQNQEKYFPAGHYLIADSAYPLQDWLLTPFDEGGVLNEEQLKFNQKHKETGKVIQNAFAHLKARFPRLQYIDMVDMEDVVKVILVCCGLHNFCMESGDTELFTDSEANEESDAVQDCDFVSHREEGIERRIEITQMLAGSEQNITL